MSLLQEKILICVIFLNTAGYPGCLALTLNSPDLYILLGLAVTNLKQKHEAFYCSLSFSHALLLLSVADLLHPSYLQSIVTHAVC